MVRNRTLQEGHGPVYTSTVPGHFLVGSMNVSPPESHIMNKNKNMPPRQVVLIISAPCPQEQHRVRRKLRGRASRCPTSIYHVVSKPAYNYVPLPDRPVRVKPNLHLTARPHGHDYPGWFYAERPGWLAGEGHAGRTGPQVPHDDVFGAAGFDGRVRQHDLRRRDDGGGGWE